MERRGQDRDPRHPPAAAERARGQLQAAVGRADRSRQSPAARLRWPKPLAFDHRGARSGEGALEFLPHVGNLTRNVDLPLREPGRHARPHDIQRSIPTWTSATRSSRTWAARASACSTTPSAPTTARCGASARTRSAATRSISTTRSDRGRRRQAATSSRSSATRLTTRRSGASPFTTPTTASCATTWSTTRAAAAIVAEDGTESFNVFEHNFALRSEGSGEFAPRSGYGGATNDPGGEGAGFWLRGPNNILRNNVAANVDVFGYGIAAGGLGTVSIPKFKGADTSKAGEFVDDRHDRRACPRVHRQRGVRRDPDRRGHRLERHARQLAHLAHLASRVDGVPDRSTRRRWVRGARRHGRAARPVREPDRHLVQQLRRQDRDRAKRQRPGDARGRREPVLREDRHEPGRGDGVATVENSYFRDYVGRGGGDGLHADHGDDAHQEGRSFATAGSSRSPALWPRSTRQPPSR